MVHNRDIIKPDLKYPEDFVNKVIFGDCMELIKLIPNNSIDVVFTDPPYGLNKNDVRGDVDLSLFYHILPECNRVLKDNSFLLHFLAQSFYHSYLITILLIIFGRLFCIALKEW